MKAKTLRSDLMLLLTSAIWGFAFVAQRSGMQYVGPFTFNGIRFMLGSHIPPHPQLRRPPRLNLRRRLLSNSFS